MTTHAHRVSVGGRHVLGITPHRLMPARRGWSPEHAASRREVNARIIWKIDRALTALFKAGRRSVFLIDTACGNGRVLIEAARRARAMGFVAIEAKGFDRSPEEVAAARRSSDPVRDPGIGLSFSVRDAGSGLPLEDEEADVMLTGDGRVPEAEIARVTDRDGYLIPRR